jgi:hypothetical protein
VQPEADSWVVQDKGAHLQESLHALGDAPARVDGVLALEGVHHQAAAQSAHLHTHTHTGGRSPR